MSWTQLPAEDAEGRCQTGPRHIVQAIVGSQATEPPLRMSLVPILSSASTASSLAAVPLYRPQEPGISDTYPTETLEVPVLLIVSWPPHWTQTCAVMSLMPPGAELLMPQPPLMLW